MEWFTEDEEESSDRVKEKTEVKDEDKSGDETEQKDEESSFGKEEGNESCPEPEKEKKEVVEEEMVNEKNSLHTIHFNFCLFFLSKSIK